tara:strand:- start:87 stop:347 length:261 start_codon:yes stop_codon:yes gene_type:complete
MKLKEIIAVAIAGLIFMLITGIAKADEKTITPQEFGQAINEVPSKVSNFVKSEVSKTKEYQTKVWAEAKTKWPWNVLLKGKNDTQN